MKLRQKLAAVLAASMIAASVPVVTMAASDNTVSHAPLVAKDTLVGFSTTTQTGTDVEIVNTPDNAPKLNVKYKTVISSSDSFILKVTDSEFAKVTAYQQDDAAATTDINAAGVKVGDMTLTRLNKNELLVQVTPLTGQTIESFNVPIYVKATGAVPTVEIIAENSQVTAGKYIIAQSTTSTKKAVATAGDAEVFYDKGTLGKITVIENAPRAFDSVTADEDRVIKVTLENDDFSFNIAQDAVVGKLTRGASGNLRFGHEVKVDPKDSGVLLIQVPKVANPSIRIAVELDGIAVSARNPELGDINVTVSGEMLDETTLTVAKVAAFNVGLSMKDDKVKDIKAGRSDKVTFTLKENIDDSIAKNRNIEFTLDNGHFMHGLESITYVNAGTTVTTTDLTTVPAGVAYTEVKASTASKINKALTLAVFKKDYLGKIKQNDAADVSKDEIVALTYSGKEVVGFEFAPSNLRAAKKDEFTFENVKVEIDVNKSGKVALKVSGERAIGEAVSIDAVNIITPVTVESTPMKLKVGLKEQIGGKVTITETDKAMLKKGESLTVKVADIDKGLSFNKEPEIKVVAGDLKLGTDIEVTKAAGEVTLTIKRESKTATKLEISNFNVNLDRTVPEGNFDLKVGGKALTDCGELTVADFFVVATPNTGDAGQLAKGTSSFVIGNKNYVVNGQTREMDAAPFIQNGRTMTPVRYVSEAFGIEGKNILFSAGTVTILAGSRTLQVTNGSDIATLKKEKIKMDGKVVIKDGRTYVPVGEMARLLGVKVEWDNATKTATFTN